MYTYIKDYCIEKIKEHPQYPKYLWKPKIVDVGCGSGCGSNVMSQEADFVWGIDKDPESIAFAKEVFTRVKNGLYYSSQVSFDRIDIIEDTREFMEFDIVVAIEIIEHIYDYKKFLYNITTKFAKKIKDDQPHNKWHVREWTGNEFYNVLSEYFNDIEFLTAKGVPINDPKTTTHTPLLAICRNPKI